ncbi:hypothetical protein VTK26DRAFT_6553 [Humicola hyalothermophila]
MAASQPGQQDQQSAGLFLNLSSNNPFRNRAASPAVPISPTSPFDDPPPRPVSRNPFLDPALTTRSSFSNIRSTSESMALEKRPSLTADEIFGSLTLEDSPKTSTPPPRPDAAAKPPAPRRGPPPPHRENAPPPGRRGPPPNHRPSRSQEEALRARRMQGKGDGPGHTDRARSPQKLMDGRPRRNSDSSIMDSDRNMSEERKREMRRRERERAHRHREAKDKERRPSRKLDIIDQLDATSIYGTGIFHHDGPFDALNPHRNRQGSRRAPMQAFPKDSLNNTLGGAGPLNTRPDHATFLGQQDDEAFKDYSMGGKDRNGANFSGSSKEVPVFDPLRRGNFVYGDESLGLGSSTFLEGTPAARTEIQRREEERAAEMMNEGLQRKKSLAHRIRNMNRGARDFQPSGRVTNPETAYGPRRSPSEGGPASASAAERNPFFSEYGSGKGGEDGFAVRQADSPSSPRRGSGAGLERRSTTDGTGRDDMQQQPKPTGILGRMKSLKGRRQRPSPAVADAEPVPGTAI